MTHNSVGETDNPDPKPETEAGQTGKQAEKPQQPREIGGPKGLEPTRYGDWEQNGRCSDF